MTTTFAAEAFDLERAGERMHALMTELFPICRSITGNGVRRTLAVLSERVPLDVHEVPSGTEVFDWFVPDEWNIRDAYVATVSGERVVDFNASNLHVVSYSEPVDVVLPLSELRKHLHALPDRPHWIPYRTSYYARSWGFCLSQRQLESLEEDSYRAVVDSTLEPGSLTYGECLLAGESSAEVLLTAHVCHPSLANDNLSGVVLLTELAARIASTEHRLSYRILFIPGTIGSLVWLARNEDRLASVVGGLVVACVGDPGPLTYKRSRDGDSAIDRAAEHVLGHSEPAGRVVEFSPFGYDERQFNSPGFALAVGALTRTTHGQYPQYHTSGDNLDLVRPQYLADSLRAYLSLLEILERDAHYLNLSPKGEPQLGRRGLYPEMGGRDAESEQLATLWVLNQSDGSRSLLDIAERSGLPFGMIRGAADRLEAAGLLERLPGPMASRRS